MRQWLGILTIPAIMVSCTEASSGVGRESRQRQEPIEVRTLVMEKVPDVRVRTYVGQARASQSVTLLSPYSGTLTGLYIKEGDMVRKGEAVAEINSEPVRSAYEMALATLDQAEDGYARIQKVHQAGAVPDIKMKEVETSLAKARAEASAARNAMQSCIVKAPFDGFVSILHAYPDSEVTALEPLAKIVGSAITEIVFQVPEGELSGMIPGGQAYVDVPALGEDGIKAVIIAKGIEASPVSHTYECVLELSEPVRGFAPGMVCKVSLVSDMKPEYIVPAEVVHLDREGTYVWTVSDGTVSKTHIVTGGYAGNGVIVTEGLDDGSRVICEGFRKVSSGMKVKVVSYEEGIK